MPSLPVAALDLNFHALRQCGEMVIQMELGFDGFLDEQRLARAVDLLLEVEPVLGCRMVLDSTPPCWEPVPRHDRISFVFTSRAEDYDVIRRCGLEATANVQLMLCLWRGDLGDRLLVKMTHQAGDGASLQLVVRRLAAIYSKIWRDSAYQPQANRESSRDFGQIIAEIPKRAFAGIFWEFTRFMAPRCFPRSTHRLPFPKDSVGPWTPVIKEVPAVYFADLSTYAKARGATLNDLFLAAAYRALASCGSWDGTSGLRIPITVDLRRWCLPSDRPRSVCNLSSVEFPLLLRNLGKDFDDTLANVTVLTTQRKRKWPGLAVALLGHAVLRLRGAMPKHRATAAGRAKVRPSRSLWDEVSLILSNEGALDGASLRFGGANLVSAYILPPFLTPPGVHVCVSSYRGSVTFATVTRQSGCGVLEKFLNVLVDQLPIDGHHNSKPVAGTGFERRDTVVDSRRLH